MTAYAVLNHQFFRLTARKRRATTRCGSAWLSACFGSKMPQVQILSPRPILPVRRKFYVREQTPLTHTAWHGKRTSRDSSSRGACRYLITVNRSDFQSEDVGSTPITCSTCCRGGTGIRERLKHAFLWVRSPAAIPNAIVAELADAADLSSTGRFP